VNVFPFIEAEKAEQQRSRRSRIPCHFFFVVGWWLCFSAKNRLAAVVTPGPRSTVFSS
jgi:hypothetical protein